MLSKCSEYLEHAYDVLNSLYFEGKLPKVVITIMSTPKAYGHITTSKIWHGTNENYREVNLAAEFLHRPIENLLATLLHESCHLYAMENGIADTSKNGKYHNKAFKQLAEQRDLHIEYVRYIGYSKTTPTQAFIDKIRANGLYIDSLENYRLTAQQETGRGGDNGDGDSDKGTTKKSYVRKYKCVQCGKSVRATTDVNIGCMDCLVVMVKVK